MTPLDLPLSTDTGGDGRVRGFSRRAPFAHNRVGAIWAQPSGCLVGHASRASFARVDEIDARQIATGADGRGQGISHVNPSRLLGRLHDAQRIRYLSYVVPRPSLFVTVNGTR